MPSLQFSNVDQVVSSRLCIGCGACQPACEKGAIELFDFLDEGIRPVVNNTESCGTCTACLEVCPGEGVDFREGVRDEGPYGKDVTKKWGPVTAIWIGHATDEVLRYKASSGGALSALAAYCVEKGGMHGTLHIEQNPDSPACNRTRMSTTREQIFAASGSRYAPASVGNGFHLVENAPAPCAIIGKPSEISAIRKTESQNPKFAEKVGMTFSFFCAETPPTRATLSLSEKLGVPESELVDLRYRGDGWPGHFAPVRRGETTPADKRTYGESWAYLQSFRPWSTQIWPDGGGELADITCGDPWYKEPDGKNPGSSLIVARTARGKALVEAAAEAGYIEIEKGEAWQLEGSQKNLLKKKGATWGRLKAMSVSGMKTPRYKNAHLFHCWNTLSFKDKLKSTVGTLRRILSRKLRKPLVLDRETARLIPPPQL